MNKIFFTSDTHFSHGNIIRYCNRPFSSAQDMNRQIIDNWNSVVMSDDIIYHLGDFAFVKNEYEVGAILSKLNGKIYFIFGNHDRSMHNFFSRPLYKEKYYHKIINLNHHAEIKIDGQAITLNHYAMRVWNKSHHGAWQLYGHSHGTLPDDPNARAIDVGVDCHNFYPISFEQIKKIILKKNFVPIDHHGS